MDEAAKHFPKKNEQDYQEDMIKFSLIGRPNVGKSSLVNAFLERNELLSVILLGQHGMRLIRHYTYNGRRYVIIDTAGMRKKGKVYESTEKYSVLRALRAIERSDVVLVVLDAEEGIIEQDKKIAGYAHEAGRAVVIVVNKWDAVEKDEKTMKEFEEKIRDHFLIS